MFGGNVFSIIVTLIFFLLLILLLPLFGIFIYSRIKKNDIIRIKSLRILTIFLGLIGCMVIALIFYENFIYKFEMNQIKQKLNLLDDVEVINIWGHRDITLEEISARIRIKNKGEIVLNDLNEDDNNYPISVSINEIGGYSFTWFSCNGEIGSSINIGTSGSLGFLFETEFNTVQDIIDNYDMIYEIISNLKIAPEINHFETKISESYLLVHNQNSIDQDPIFNLVGVYNLVDYAKTLKWNRSDSYYNRDK